MSSELEQTQLEIAKLQLERERRRMRAEEAVGSAARSAAVRTTRAVGGVLRVAGQIVLGAVIGLAVACGLVTLLAMVTPFPREVEMGYRVGFLLGAHHSKIVIAALCAAVLYPVMRSRSSRRAR